MPQLCDVTRADLLRRQEELRLLEEQQAEMRRQMQVRQSAEVEALQRREDVMRQQQEQEMRMRQMDRQNAGGFDDGRGGGRRSGWDQVGMATGSTPLNCCLDAAATSAPFESGGRPRARRQTGGRAWLRLLLIT